MTSSRGRVKLVWRGVGETSFIDMSTPALTAPGRGSLGDHWVLVAGRSIVRVYPAGTTKKEAISEATRLLRETNSRWEFTIYRKDGQICAGDAAKRTYGGGDPRRSKG